MLCAPLSEKKERRAKEVSEKKRSKNLIKVFFLRAETSPWHTFSSLSLKQASGRERKAILYLFTLT
jgi:hypothetical protein